MKLSHMSTQFKEAIVNHTDVTSLKTSPLLKSPVAAFRLGFGIKTTILRHQVGSWVSLLLRELICQQKKLTWGGKKKTSASEARRYCFAGVGYTLLQPPRMLCQHGQHRRQGQASQRNEHRAGSPYQNADFRHLSSPTSKMGQGECCHKSMHKGIRLQKQGDSHLTNFLVRACCSRVKTVF